MRPLARPLPPRRLAAALIAALVACPAAHAQQASPNPVRLDGMGPGGVRSTITQSWGTLDFTVTNFGDTDRMVRAVAFYGGPSDLQYGRDVWVPARSAISSWLLFGPPPTEPSTGAVEIQSLLYLREGSDDRLVLPRGEERIRSRLASYRKPEPSTAMLLDETPTPPEVEGQLPQPESRDDEAVRLVRTVRHHSRNLSYAIHVVGSAPLPPTPQAFDGIRHFVIASDRLADDPAGLRALRHWLEQGGRVWVMLDRVSPDTLAPLLGGALDFEVAARVGLTHFTIRTVIAGGWAPETQEHERPVDFVRVVLPPGEEAAHTIDGWPTWFTRRVGRGIVFFTTLGPRGWYRPRGPKDGPSRYTNFPKLPVPRPALEPFADELEPPPEPEAFPAEAFRPLLTAEIGYEVLDRGTVALIFGGAVLAALALGFVLRRSARPELLAYLGPAAALAAVAALVVLGESARRAAPPTVAIAQVVYGVPGQNEAAARGLLAVYRPESGPAEAGARRGGFFSLDIRGSQGQVRRFVTADADSWRWENLELPAGVRFAPFHATAPTAGPVRAVAGFGPDGLRGHLNAGGFRDPADAVLTAANGRNLAVRLEPDGAFRAGSADVLPPGQFLAGAVLSDRQQRRQALYQQLLKRDPAKRADRGNVLLAWAEPADLHFALAPGARRVGTALLVVPLKWERPAPGTRVTVPGPLVTVSRLVEEDLAVPLPPPSTQGVRMRLRFQPPEAVLPLHTERARLTLKINAPGRRVTVAAPPPEGGKGPVGAGRELRRVDSPLDPIRLDLTAEDLLRADKGGGLRLDLMISEAAQEGGAGTGGNPWAIEYCELELVGTTGAAK